MSKERSALPEISDIICNHLNKRIKSRNMCSACYSKLFRKYSPKSICHPNRKQHTSEGLCRQCWDIKYRQKAVCHPDRPHVAGGLCSQCYKLSPEHINKARITRRLSKYGLTSNEYDELIIKQDYKCAICGDAPTDIDHDHTTGEVRGILCKQCNTGLGNFKDNISILQRAIEYLKGLQC